MKYNELTSKVKEYQDRIKELEIENEDFRLKVQDTIRNFTGAFRVRSGNIRSGNYIEGISGWSLGPESAELRNVTVSGTITGSTIIGGTMTVGSGDSVFKIGDEGIWLGDADYDSAPFRVSMDGAIAGSNFSLTNINGDLDDINDGDTYARVVKANLDTSAKEILSDFTFGESGALKMIADADNGLWLSPTGILGKSGGNTTFSIGTDGSAVFKGSIQSGSTITGTTITAGTFQTDSSGQRILLQGSDNTLRFYDSAAEVIGIGATESRAIDMALNSTTYYGVVIAGATEATGIGYRYTNTTSDINNSALNIAMGDDNTNNGWPAIDVAYGGNDYAMDIDLYGNDGPGGIYLLRHTGAGSVNPFIRMYDSTTNDIPLLQVQKAYTGNLNGPIVDIEQFSRGIALQVDHSNTDADNPSLKIMNNGETWSSSALLIDKDSWGYAIEIDQDMSTNYGVGIYMNINNSGDSTGAYAFSFEGNETLGSAVGGTQNQKIRVWAGGAEYYIPCYTA